MTKVAVYEAKGKMYGFTARGHAQYAEPGDDIVCAGISTATQMAVVAIQDVLEAVCNVVEDKDTLSIIVIEHDKCKLKHVDLILQAMYLVLESIAIQYDNHLNIKKEALVDYNKGRGGLTNDN